MQTIDAKSELTPELIQGLREALERSGGTHTIQDVVDALRNGEAQVWVKDSAVLVTEVLAMPRALVLHFWLAAGELEPVIALSRDVLAWGKEQGCTGATLTGRPGWKRALASEGWSSDLIMMTREF